jgi:micrococcal nuclease
MRWLAAGFVIALTATVSAAVSDTAARASAAAERTRVARVVDGDTIVLTSGLRVRLLQIDTPEPGTASASRAPPAANCGAC